MFNYAQLNEECYCIGVSQLTNKIEKENVILIDGNLGEFLGRKYDLENNCWTDEYLEESSTNIMTNAELFQLQLQSDIEYLKILAEINGGL